MTNSHQEPNDYHIYAWVHFHRDTLEFYLAAVRFYKSLLTEGLKVINEDEDLKIILNQKELKSFPIHQEIDRTRRVLDWLEKEINREGEDGWFYTVNVSHGTIRFIKSVSTLYIEHLNRRRNALSSRPRLSKTILEALDQKLSTLEEKIQTGVFRDATPYPLIVNQLPDIEDVEKEIVTSVPMMEGGVRPRPVIIETIEIQDRALRERCLDLFNQFKENGQHDRLDTVVSEATRILEDRLRSLSAATSTCTGVELAKYIFGQQPPRLIVSDIPAEQEAAHLLFRGVFGFIRNSVHHRLVATLQPERVLQIVGMIDYLIFVAEGARRNH